MDITFYGSADIIVSPDNMKAEIILHLSIEDGSVPTEEGIIEHLGQKGIIYGIDEEKLKNVLDSMARGECPKGPVTIAEGIAPVDGENGIVEFLFDTETLLEPKINGDGIADFKNVNLIQTVSAGAELARLIPDSKGTPGKDITGRELPCKDGNPAELPVGTNTKISPEDKNVLIAEVDGNVRYNGTVVEVSEGFVIEGDVDYSSGNIKYEKSVMIGGDVKAGFKVECGGDLQVAGIVEDAEIRVEGNVLCKLGFLGQGKGLIEAKGDVNIGFARNVTIRSHGNVNIAKEAFNCNIFARKLITIDGEPISAVGGTLVARDSIVLRNVGNQSGIKTAVEVGTDFVLVKEIEKIEEKLTESNQNLTKVEKAVKRFMGLLKVKKKLPEKDEVLYAKLKNAFKKFKIEIELLEKRKKAMSEKMYNFEKAYIKIERSAMPGTFFTVGKCHYLVSKEIIGPKTVRLTKDQIRIV